MRGESAPICADLQRAALPAGGVDLRAFRSLKIHSCSACALRRDEPSISEPSARYNAEVLQKLRNYVTSAFDLHHFDLRESLVDAVIGRLERYAQEANRRNTLDCIDECAYTDDYASGRAEFGQYAGCSTLCDCYVYTRTENEGGFRDAERQALIALSTYMRQYIALLKEEVARMRDIFSGVAEDAESVVSLQKWFHSPMELAGMLQNAAYRGFDLGSRRAPIMEAAAQTSGNEDAYVSLTLVYFEGMQAKTDYALTMVERLKYYLEDVITDRNSSHLELAKHSGYLKQEMAKNAMLRKTNEEISKYLETARAERYSIYFENDISSLSLLRYVLFSATLYTENVIGRLANNMRTCLSGLKDVRNPPETRIYAASRFIQYLYEFYCSDFPVHVSQQFVTIFDISFTHVQSECFGAKARADILRRYKLVKYQNALLSACLQNYIVSYGDRWEAEYLLRQPVL